MTNDLGRPKPLHDEAEEVARSFEVYDPRVAETIRGLVAENKSLLLEAAGLRARSAEERHRIEVQRELIEVLRGESERDALTGIHNLNALKKQAQSIFEKLREEGRDLSVLYIDLNHFKVINDTFSHDAGDTVLKDFVSRIRVSDLFFRIGGDEFLIMLPETDFDGAMKAAERLRVEIESMKMEFEGKPVDITISVGAATMTEQDQTFNDLKNRADKGTKYANENGRNRAIGVAPDGEFKDVTAPDSYRPPSRDRYDKNPSSD